MLYRCLLMQEVTCGQLLLLPPRLARVKNWITGACSVCRGAWPRCSNAARGCSINEDPCNGMRI